TQEHLNVLIGSQRPQGGNSRVCRDAQWNGKRACAEIPVPLRGAEQEQLVLHQRAAGAKSIRVVHVMRNGSQPALLLFRRNRVQPGARKRIPSSPVEFISSASEGQVGNGGAASAVLRRVGIGQHRHFQDCFLVSRLIRLASDAVVVVIKAVN